MITDEVINYIDLDDIDLINLSKKNDTLAFEVLINRHSKFIAQKTSPYFIQGTEKEDLLQEALIGFYKAVRDYNFGINKSFLSFATLCIRRQIITAIKAALRKKHEIHLNSISFDKSIEVNNRVINLLDIIPDKKATCPEMVLIHKEETYFIKKAIKHVLSDLEFSALTMYYNGLSYNDIANKLGRNYKSIDASINRAKIKLRKYFLDEQTKFIEEAISK